jgi:hypothetical protein
VWVWGGGGGGSDASSRVWVPWHWHPGVAAAGGLRAEGSIRGGFASNFQLPTPMRFFSTAYPRCPGPGPGPALCPRWGGPWDLVIPHPAVCDQLRDQRATFSHFGRPLARPQPGCCCASFLGCQRGQSPPPPHPPPLMAHGLRVVLLLAHRSSVQ